MKHNADCPHERLSQEIVLGVRTGDYYCQACGKLFTPADLRNLDNPSKRTGAKIGKDAVVMGNVSSNLEVGDGSVVIGSTDSNGNTILNQQMAVGRNAQAGPQSIAIGAGANAGGGINLPAILRELNLIAEEARDPKFLSDLAKLVTELSRPEPSGSILANAWGAVKASATTSGAICFWIRFRRISRPSFPPVGNQCDDKSRWHRSDFILAKPKKDARKLKFDNGIGSQNVIYRFRGL